MVGLLKTSQHMESRRPFVPCPCPRVFSTISAREPKSDVYRSCQLLLNKKTCWIIALMLNTVTVVASHSHCHFNPLFKKQNKPLVLSERNLTWKELLTYTTTVRLKIRLQAARPEKTGQLYFLELDAPTSLGEKTTHFQPPCFRCL